MKIRILCLLILSATISAAQAPSQTKPSLDKPQASADPAASTCPCCQKMMADKKDARSCCNHDQGSKAAMCCEGKDAKCPMKADKDKTAASCCMGEKSSSDTDKSECCAKHDKSTEHSAMACCGSNQQQCGMMGHDHPDISK